MRPAGFLKQLLQFTVVLVVLGFAWIGLQSVVLQVVEWKRGVERDIRSIKAVVFKPEPEPQRVDLSALKPARRRARR